MPLWEAATAAPRVTVPRASTLRAAACCWVTAWDAPEVTPYSVAGLRQLRVPTDLPGPPAATAAPSDAVPLMPELPEVETAAMSWARP